MPFNANIPQPADQLSQSQADVLGNFQAIGGMLDLTVGATAIKFARDGAVPPTAATDVGLYAANSVTFPGTTALFFRNQNNGTSVDITSSLAAANGWTRLPSGILLKWGTGAAAGGANVTTVVAFPVAANIPVFAHIYSAQISAQPTGGGGDHFALYLEAYVVASISVKQDSAIGRNFTYLAIGD